MSGAGPFLKSDSFSLSTESLGLVSCESIVVAVVGYVVVVVVVVVVLTKTLLSSG
jgi:hypothetical protein